jgi:hypothetical protein
MCETDCPVPSNDRHAARTGSTGEADMAKGKKRNRVRKPTAARVSRKMAGVRPLRGEPGVGRRYDPGFRPPKEGSPWQDEGEPEVNG